jgi:hypothetical protein
MREKTLVKIALISSIFGIAALSLLVLAAE